MEMEFKMNISIISSRFDSIIEKIENSFKNKKNNSNEDIKIGKSIISFWKWIPINNNKTDDNVKLILDFLEEKIDVCSNKDKNHTFKEVFIIEADNISEVQLI